MTATTNTSSPAEPDGQTPPSSDSPGQTPTPPMPTQSGTQQQKTSIDSLPADIQDYIARLRAEAEEANRKSKAEARAKVAAEEQRLKEQGEFKALAEKHEARLRELEPQMESYTRLAQQLQAQIEQDIKAWPEEIKAFDPGSDVPIEQRLAWVQKSRPLLEKLQAQTEAAKPVPGNRPNPPALNNPAAADMTKYTQNLLRSGKYGA